MTTTWKTTKTTRQPLSLCWSQGSVVATVAAEAAAAAAAAVVAETTDRRPAETIRMPGRWPSSGWASNHRFSGRWQRVTVLRIPTRAAAVAAVAANVVAAAAAVAVVPSLRHCSFRSSQRRSDQRPPRWRSIRCPHQLFGTRKKLY